MNNVILITGGLGYIGSHICLKLLICNYHVLVIDKISLHKQKIFQTFSQFKNFKFIEGNLNNLPLKNIFYENNVVTVIHCAGKKDFSESWNNPDAYINDNVFITKNLLINLPISIKNFIFLSTCMVYGNHEIYKENTEPLPQSPYAQSKYFQENLIINHAKKYNYNVAILRVFNPIGCYNNYHLGENINNSNMIIPAILKCLLSEQKTFNIYGNQFNTIDGTTVRDYIHIDDLVYFIMNYLDKYSYFTEKIQYWNVGSSSGLSVEQLLAKFESIMGLKVNRNYIEPRKCENPLIVANIDKAQEELNWFPKKNINDALNSIIEPLLKIKNI